MKLDPSIAKAYVTVDGKNRGFIFEANEAASCAGHGWVHIESGDLVLGFPPDMPISGGRGWRIFCLPSAEALPLKPLKGRWSREDEDRFVSNMWCRMEERRPLTKRQEDLLAGVMARRAEENERAHAVRLARHPELARVKELSLSERFPERSDLAEKTYGEWILAQLEQHFGAEISGGSTRS